MRAIPNIGLRPVAGKTSCRQTGTTSLFENDRPHGGLLRWRGPSARRQNAPVGAGHARDPKPRTSTDRHSIANAGGLAPPHRLPLIARMAGSYDVKDQAGIARRAAPR